MTTFSYGLKIPKERVAVLIGKKGEVKRQLEEETKTKIKIDSEEGDVFVEGEDAISLYSTREIIKAVGRGFNPEIALQLLKPDYAFELINIDEYAKTKNSLLRLKGRIIGKEGKSRRVIEELTETEISVYGKTAGIIGQTENVSIARKAIENLIKGSTHAKIYKFLEKQRRSLKQKEMVIYDDTDSA